MTNGHFCWVNLMCTGAWVTRDIGDPSQHSAKGTCADIEWIAAHWPGSVENKGDAATVHAPDGTYPCDEEGKVHGQAASLIGGGGRIELSLNARYGWAVSAGPSG
jgi:hypothetical protein